MKIPWIEIINIPTSENMKFEQNTDKVNNFHALFALQVNVPTAIEQLEMKRGFNLSAYYDENQQRQRNFIESQRAVDIKSLMELQARRTLTIRCINRVNEGVLISIIGKALGSTEVDAKEQALSYYREIISLFPYDYRLTPATSKKEFHYLVGFDILNNNNEIENVLKIKRYEISILPSQEEEKLTGFWQDGPFSDELIWRALGGLPYDVFLNISLKPTILAEEEKNYLRAIELKTTKLLRQQNNPTYSARYKTWIEPIVERRIAPGARFFYLQVHLVSKEKITDDLIRAVGTAITHTSGGRGYSDKPSPGYDVLNPINSDEASRWRQNIDLVEIIPPTKESQLSRLADLADVKEASAVCRFPIPPAIGFPGIRFLSKDIQSDS